MTVTHASNVVGTSLMVLLMLPLFASAESVVWSQVQPDLIQMGCPNGTCDMSSITWSTSGMSSHAIQYAAKWGTHLFDPMVSVTYKVAAFEVDAAGNQIRSLSSGTSVPPNTRVLLKFVPHEYTDIYWFGTGGSWDSPYGDWLAGAGAPPESDRCSPKNLYAADIAYQDDDPDNGGITAQGALDLYAALSVAPPGKSLTASGAGSSCVTHSDGVSKICTITSGGTFSAQFAFAPTTGKFYGGYRVDVAALPSGTITDALVHAGGNHCAYTSRIKPGAPMERFSGAFETGNANNVNASAGSYTLQVPERTIPFTLAVADVPGSPPSTPTLSGGACAAGTPHTITMQATDPENDQIRYAIDWNNDGSIDEYAPPGTGAYIPSGTQQQATRTFIAGNKTVKVRAEDQSGQASDWASISFTCTDDSGDDDDDGQNPPPPPPPPPPPTTCAPASFCKGRELWNQSVQCIESFSRVCVFGCSLNGCGSVPANSGNIIAEPALLGSGGTTRISWETNGMLANTCTVTENNPMVTDTDDGPSGTFTSSPLTQQTTYTLGCTRESGGTFTDSVVVNILPVFQED